jgi:hypothetical protein
MSSLCRSFIVAAAIWLLSVAPAAPQTRQHVTRAPAELFAAFVRERQSLNNQTNASLDLTHVLIYHSDYPPADVEYLLRELEQFALTGTPQWLRGEAVVRLSISGSNRAVRPTAGTFARLQRVYRRSSDPEVKSMVVDAMGTLVESREACAFLERVATKQPGDFPDAAGKAMTSLLTQGDQGRVVLKRLHETGTVRDPRAKRSLAILAKHGFRLP